MKNTIRRIAALGTALLLATGCQEPTATLANHDGPATQLSTGSVLIECPSSTTLSAEADIGTLGGTLAIGNTKVMIPSGAVLLPTRFVLRIPASNYMEISVTAGGQDHFEFMKPVAVSIDYSRCTRSDINRAPLSIWHINETTKALIENMGGSDNKTTRIVEFTTDHFTGYAVAY